MDDYRRRTAALSLWLLVLGCSRAGGRDGESTAAGGPTGETLDGATAGATGIDTAHDGATTATTGGPADGSGGNPSGLELRIDTPDGDCVDLGITDRPGYALRFMARGPANTAAELWVSRPQCGVDPFVYHAMELDDAGEAVFDLSHGGTSECADALLGGWTAWLAGGGEGEEVSNEVNVVFSHHACADLQACAASGDFCPSPLPPFIRADQLFVLSEEERSLFTPPDPGWINWGTNTEDYPLRNLWEAFDTGAPVLPLDTEELPAGWFQPDGAGSQNHALLWLGVAALGYGLAGDITRYEDAADKCLTLLELDRLQGHMRHEAIGGYTGFWEGGIATMALAGVYAPLSSTSGPELLAAARSWWGEHVAALRRLALPDGQVALIGARLAGEPGSTDAWQSLSAAVNLQLLAPRPHDHLHPNIASLVTADGRPAAGTEGVPINWFRPRHVAERWVVLRAIQAGALPSVPEDQPRPAVVQDVFRWAEGDVIHTAVPQSTGFRPARFKVRWSPGAVIEVEVGDPEGTPPTGKGPHLPPLPLDIPKDAALLLGPPR
jgi:hypothetical protein